MELAERRQTRTMFRILRQVYVRLVYRLRYVDPSAILIPPGNVSRDIRVGAYSFINYGFSIPPLVTLGKYVMFGPEVQILGGDHCIETAGTPIIFSGRPYLKPTVVGDDVWVGARTIIMAGVTVGAGSVIGAASVVTKDVPPNTICAGNPARPIRRRFESTDWAHHEAMLAKPAVAGRYAGRKLAC